MFYFETGSDLICGKCGGIFTTDQAKIRDKNLYGTIIKEKCCPYCGSIGYTAMKDVGWLSNFKEHM